MEKIIKVCAWCETKMDEETSSSAESESPEVEVKYSHGICENCNDTWFGYLKEDETP